VFNDIKICYLSKIDWREQVPFGGLHWKPKLLIIKSRAMKSITGYL